MPFVGFYLISLRLVGLPMLVFVFAPSDAAVLILSAGFLPSLVPSALFVFLRSPIGPFRAWLAAVIGSLASATLWLGYILPGEFDDGLLHPWFLGSAALAPCLMLLSLVRPEQRSTDKPRASRLKIACLRLENAVFSRLFRE